MIVQGSYRELTGSSHDRTGIAQGAHVIVQGSHSDRTGSSRGSYRDRTVIAQGAHVGRTEIAWGWCRNGKIIMSSHHYTNTPTDACQGRYIDVVFSIV